MRSAGGGRGTGLQGRELKKLKVFSCVVNQVLAMPHFTKRTQTQLPRAAIPPGFLLAIQCFQVAE